MNAFDVLNLFSASLSIVLAAVALWLSLYFFRQSSQQAKQADANAGQIAASVDRLEKLFNTLYSDTFAMMRETVTDMRAHIWPVSQATIDAEKILLRAEDAAKARIADAKAELLAQISAVSKVAGVDDDQVGGMLQKLEPVVTKVLGESSEAGAERAAKTSFITSIIHTHLASKARLGHSEDFSELVTAVSPYGFSVDDVALALIAGRKDGWVEWDGPPEAIGERDTIRLRPN